MQETARVLNVLAGGVVGLGSGYDEEVLQNQAVSLLLNKMKSSQSDMRAQIIGHVNDDVLTYPLAMARFDVDKLGNAATFEAAIQAIAAMTEEERKAFESKENASRDGIACANAKKNLAEALASNNAELKAKLDELQKAFFKANGISVSLDKFQADCIQAGQMNKLTTKLNELKAKEAEG